MKPVNIGIIGPGWASYKLYGAFILRRPELNLHSVYSRSLARAENFATEFSSKGPVRAFDDLGAMLADEELDAVAVVNPDGVHAKFSILAAKAGKSVFVEKPMGITSSECEQIIATCSAAKVKLAVGYRLRFHGGHQAIVNALHAGTFGRLRHVRMHMELAEFGNGGWRNREDLGRWWALSKFGTHMIDMALWAVDRPVAEIKGFNGIIRQEEGRKDRDSSLSWAYDDGPSVQIFTTNVWGDSSSTLEFHTDTHIIEMINTIGFDCGGSIRIDGEELDYELAWEFGEQFADFACAIREDREPMVTGAIGLENVRLLEMCDEKAITAQIPTVAPAR